MITVKTKKIDERISENYTKIKMCGIAEIIHKDNVIKCKNKFTRYFMSSIVNIIGFSGYYESGYMGTVSYVEYTPSGLSLSVSARVGIDTSTPTNPDMSDLISKVDVAPDSVTRRLIKEPDYTLYIYEVVFLWNAGTLPNIYIGATAEGNIDGKVGEFGVYLYTDNDDWQTGLLNPMRHSLVAGGWSFPVGGAEVRLASRIASADGAFDPFEFYGSIDPLVFKWRFQVAIV